MYKQLFQNRRRDDDGKKRREGIGRYLVEYICHSGLHCGWKRQVYHQQIQQDAAKGRSHRAEKRSGKPTHPVCPQSKKLARFRLLHAHEDICGQKK